VLLKTARGGQVLFGAPEVPLADAHGGVVARPQHIGEGGLVEAEAVLVLREEDARDSDPRRAAPREQAGARGRTHRVRRVAVGEAAPVRRQAVEVRGPDARPVTAEIAVAKVVGQNQNDVRRPGTRGRERQSQGGACDTHGILKLASVHSCSSSAAHSARKHIHCEPGKAHSRSHAGRLPIRVAARAAAPPRKDR
jgi:hypothetical protein